MYVYYMEKYIAHYPNIDQFVLSQYLEHCVSQNMSDVTDAYLITCGTQF